MKTLKLAILGLALLASPAFSAPVAVTGAGQSWSLDYNAIVDVNGTPSVMSGLSARVDYLVTNLSYDSTYNLTLLSMDVVISNTSNTSLWQFGSVGGLAFDTNPNVVRAGTGAVGALGYVALGQTLPGSSGFTVEVCVSGRKNQCDSVNPYGVKHGQTGTASVQLAFRGNVLGQAIDLSNFAVRWTDLVSSQYGPAALEGYGVPVTPPIPEPASAAVFGLGALIVGAALRRKRS
jgi:hypothetical protein